MARNEVKYGALLSYVLIIINSLYGLVITPYILSTIGESEYGVYKTIGALTASISVLELGIGGTLQRYIAKFNAQKDTESCRNFSAMGMLQAGVLSAAMLIVGIALFFTIDSVYGGSFSALELIRSKQIFLVQLLYIMLHIFENAIFGIIAGYNRFTFSNSLKITVLLIKIALFIIVLPIFRNSLTIVTVSVILEILTVFAELFFLRKVLKHRIKLIKWNNALFKDSLGYTILIFIQSLIIQFNGNIDNIVIGAVIGTSAVTVYSFAIQIFNMYEQCATSVSGVILPTVTNQIEAGATASDLEKTVVKYGRVQWMILGAALFGFLVCGKEFFWVWLGEKYNDCWYLALILMIPVTFALIVNVCLAILKAKNLLKFRTISMLYSVVINVILTVVGTHFGGYWAAAAGTAASTLVGSVVSMNIYYYKKLGLNMFRLYHKIFNRTFPCLLAACMPCLILNRYIYGSWLTFFIKVAAFVAVYGAAMLFYGLNSEEKTALFVFYRRKKK